MCLKYTKKTGKDVVELVHDQLEAFKYIGGFEPDGEGGEQESGEGLPVSIVTLPDFVLDFNRDHVHGDKPTCSVGGHAGQISSVLMHLLSDEDATHRVHYLTCSGNLASLLLENEFSQGDPEEARDTYLRYCAPFVIRREGEPRCAYRDTQTLDPSQPKRTDEISAKEHILGKPFVLDAIAAAQAVYIGSFKTPDYHNILSAIVDTMSSGSTGVETERGATNRPKSVLFLDTCRSVDSLRPPNETNNKLKAMFKSLKTVLTEHPGRAIPDVVLFVNDKEAEVISRAAAEALMIQGEADGWLREIAETLHVRILNYGPKTVTFYSPFDSETSGILLEHSCEDVANIDQYTRFRAGVILSSTAYRTLQTVPDVIAKYKKTSTRKWGLDLYQHFSLKWEVMDSLGSGGWCSAVAYGVALASVSTFRPRHSLLKTVCEVFGIKDHVQSNADDATFERIIHGIKRIRLDDNIPSKIARLAARRRHCKLKNDGLAGCSPHPKSCLTECSIATQKAAVMIDLDGTLMDSGKQRGRALGKALDELHGMTGVLPDTFRKNYAITSERVMFFEKHVYDRHKLFKALEKGDFRQQWNHPGWYAAYIVLACNNSHDSHLDTAAGSSPEDLSRNLDIQEFVQSYERTLRDRGVEIGKAMRAFSCVPLHPLKEARDFLSSLEATEAFNLYIVSEGHPDTQWSKLESTGLSEFFERSHVLTTGDVAPEYDNERKEFERELAELESLMKRSESRLWHFESDADTAHRISADVQMWEIPCNTDHSQDAVKLARAISEKYRETAVENQKRVKKDIVDREMQIRTAKWVGLLLQRLQAKLSLAFYSAVVRSIMRNPQRPLDTLRDLQQVRLERVESPRKKFAMIGDRQMKDLHPPQELLAMRGVPSHRGLITIRLLSGKYAVSKTESPDLHDTYPPDFLALTLAHAKAILLSPSAWRQCKCLDRAPNLYNWGISFDKESERIPKNPEDNDEKTGIDVLLCGMAMDPAAFPVISQLCASFVSEYVGYCDDDRREEIVTAIWPVKECKSKKSYVQAIVCLSAFIRAGGLSNLPRHENEEMAAVDELTSYCKASQPSWEKDAAATALFWLQVHADSESAKQKAKDHLSQVWPQG